MKNYRISLGDRILGLIHWVFIKRCKEGDILDVAEVCLEEFSKVRCKDFGGVVIDTYWIEEIDLLSFDRDKDRT